MIGASPCTGCRPGRHREGPRFHGEQFAQGQGIYVCRLPASAAAGRRFRAQGDLGRRIGARSGGDASGQLCVVGGGRVVGGAQEAGQPCRGEAGAAWGRRLACWGGGRRVACRCAGFGCKRQRLGAAGACSSRPGARVAARCARTCTRRCICICARASTGGGASSRRGERRYGSLRGRRARALC